MARDAFGMIRSQSRVLPNVLKSTASRLSAQSRSQRSAIESTTHALLIERFQASPHTTIGLRTRPKATSKPRKKFGSQNTLDFSTRRVLSGNTLDLLTSVHTEGRECESHHLGAPSDARSLWVIVRLAIHFLSAMFLLSGLETNLLASIHATDYKLPLCSLSTWLSCPLGYRFNLQSSFSNLPSTRPYFPCSTQIEENAGIPVE